MDWLALWYSFIGLVTVGTLTLVEPDEFPALRWKVFSHQTRLARRSPFPLCYTPFLALSKATVTYYFTHALRTARDATFDTS